MGPSSFGEAGVNDEGGCLPLLAWLALELGVTVGTFIARDPRGQGASRLGGELGLEGGKARWRERARARKVLATRTKTHARKRVTTPMRSTKLAGT